jgi:CheY-like chemotaxis protein
LVSAQAKSAVLIVDDDRDVREVMVDLLESAGRQAFSVGGGHDALAMLERPGLPRPCMILLDWLMSPMQGGEFLAHLQARPDARELPVVIMTALDRDVAEDELGPAVIAVLRKPFQVDELLATLARVDGPSE